MNRELRIRLLLAMQASLLGNISNNIRGISCKLIGNDISVKIVFNGEISTEDIESMDEVGSELASHFHDEKVDIKCVRIDAPQSYQGEMFDWWVYRRKE